MSRLPLVLMFLACVSCSKKQPASQSTSGSAAIATEGSAGSAEMAGSAGSAEMAGSGSAMAGSGSAAEAAGSGSAAAMAGSGSAAEEAEGSGEGSGFDFDKLSQDDKMKFMKEHVVPEMKTAFQKFNAKRYAKFGCKTCHGKDPKARKFKMPNPELPKLDFAALKAGKQKPKVAEFMKNVVTPDMAKLLNMPEYSEQNPKGFGCLACHEEKKAK